MCSPAGDKSAVWAHVRPYLELYGGSAISNSTLINPEFQHFYVQGIGSIVYITVQSNFRSVVCVVGDPLCSKEHWLHISQMFLAIHPNAMFKHITASYAKVLQDIGFIIDGLGAETRINVQQFKYSARTRTIRASARNARAAGIWVRELHNEHLDSGIRAQLQAITSELQQPMSRLRQSQTTTSLLSLLWM